MHRHINGQLYVATKQVCVCGIVSFIQSVLYVKDEYYRNIDRATATVDGLRLFHSLIGRVYCCHNASPGFPLM